MPAVPAARAPGSRFLDRSAWVLLLVFMAAGLLWGAHQPYSWDADNIAPGSVLRGIAQKFGPGWYSSYGPVPYLVVAAVYVPVLGVMRLTGELGTPERDYPWGFAHPDVSIAALIVLARLVSLLFALIAVATMARAAFPDPAARRRWLVPLLALGSPVFLYYSRTSNVDMHYLLWLAIAFHLLERASGRTRWLAGAAAAAALAVCSKEQSAPFAAVVMGAALIAAWRRGAGRFAAAAAIPAAATAAYAAAWMLPVNLAGWRAHHDFIFHVAKYQRTYPLTPEGFRDLGARLIELLPVAFGWPVLAAIPLALVLRAPLAGLGARGLACAIYLALFVGPVGYVYPRFLLPLLLFAIPFAARAWGLAFQRAAAFAGMPFALGAALALLVLGGGPNLAVVQLTDARQGVVRWMRGLPEGASIEVAGNPRFQAPVPRRAPAFYTTLDSLRAAPRGPRGDVVLLSSLDEAFFRRDSVARPAYWDSLAGPDSPYRPPLWFRPPRPTGNVRDLFVSPTVQAYVRRSLPLGSPARADSVGP